MNPTTRPPIVRKCDCGCKRTFTVPFQSVKKRYYDRHCANNHTERTTPRRYMGAQRTAGVKPRLEWQLCEAA